MYVIVMSGTRLNDIFIEADWLLSLHPAKDFPVASI
jgi:hypothetical protein